MKKWVLCVVSSTATALIGIGSYYLYRSVYKRQKAKYLARLLIENIKNAKPKDNNASNEINKLLEMNKVQTD